MSSHSPTFFRDCEDTKNGWNEDTFVHQPRQRELESMSDSQIIQSYISRKNHWRFFSPYGFNCSLSFWKKMLQGGTATHSRLVRRRVSLQRCFHIAVGRETGKAFKSNLEDDVRRRFPPTYWITLSPLLTLAQIAFHCYSFCLRCGPFKVVFFPSKRVREKKENWITFRKSEKLLPIFRNYLKKLIHYIPKV